MSEAAQDQQTNGGPVIEGTVREAMEQSGIERDAAVEQVEDKGASEVLKKEYSPEQKETIDDLRKKGTDAHAQKDFVDAMDSFADAQALSDEQFGEMSVQSADLLFLYAKSAFQYGICQTALDPNNVGALPVAAKEDTPPPSNRIASVVGNPLIVLQEDDEEEQEAETGMDPETAATGAEKDGEAADEGDDPWQSAWDAFEVARVIFDKAGPDYRMKVAFCLEYLGDISLEKEEFMVASEDYKAALTIFETLHDDSAKSWRQLAGVRSQITIALEVVPDERSNALKYAESAMASAQKALEKYKTEDAQNPEIQTLAEVIEDIAVKVEELKAPSVYVAQLAENLAEKFTASLPEDTPVNDLSKMVKKKKKPAAVTEPAASTEASKKTAPAPLDAVQPLGERKHGNGVNEANVTTEKEADGAEPPQKRLRTAA